MDKPIPKIAFAVMSFILRCRDMIRPRENILKEELYCKQQEIAQYKESLESFIRNNSYKEIGIIFYKNKA